MGGTALEVTRERSTSLDEVELHPDGADLVAELELRGELGVLLEAQDIVDRDVAAHAAVADQVITALLVLGNALGHVTDDVDLDLLDGRLRAAPPVVDGRELERLHTYARRHPAGVDEVRCLNQVAIPELRLGVELEGIGQAAIRDCRQSGRDVRDDVQLVVEFEQAVEEVLIDLDIGLSVDRRRVQAADVAVDREAQRLVGRESRIRGGGATAGREKNAERSYYRQVPQRAELSYEQVTHRPSL